MSAELLITRLYNGQNIIFIVLGNQSASASALAHVISYDTNLSLRTILLLITAKLTAAISGVAPLEHPGTVLGEIIITSSLRVTTTVNKYLREDTALLPLL